MTKKVLIVNILILTIILSACGGNKDIEQLLTEPVPENIRNIPEKVYEKFSKDIMLARKNINSNTDIYNSWILLGTAYKNLGESEKAFLAYDKATKVGPQGITAWLNRSSVLEDMGEWEKAAESYRTTIQSVAAVPQAYFRLGIILRQYLKAPEEEIRAHYDQAVQLTGFNTLITEDYLKYLVLDLEDEQTAEKVLEAALQKRPENSRFLEIQESWDNL